AKLSSVTRSTVLLDKCQICLSFLQQMRRDCRRRLTRESTFFIMWFVMTKTPGNITISTISLGNALSAHEFPLVRPSSREAHGGPVPGETLMVAAAAECDAFARIA